MSDTNNTRKYPRTMLEAFPKDPRNAYTITRHKPPMDVDMWVGVVCIFALGFVLGLVCGG
mgnify:CR=1 FL=1